MESSQRIVHSLAEITGSIGRCIKRFYGIHRWAKAEITKLNLFRNGNCYPELVQTENGKTIASCKGVIWSRTYNKINQKFIETVGSPLADGMTVVFEFYTVFDDRRGLSLVITDIDIDSVIGESARTKIDTINRLKSEGVFALNHNIPEPRLIQRIAVVSVSTGKGYADFAAAIEGNSEGYRYFAPLFSAAMVGDRAVGEITAQLANIAAHKHLFDAVVIIRGGGGDASLAFFNSYELAKAVAEFPLPVLTGIGHATNKTAVEETAYHSFATPSELASYIIDKTRDAERNFVNLVKSIHQKMSAIVSRNQSRLAAENRTIKIHISNIINNNRQKLRSTTQRIHALAMQKINENRRYRLAFAVKSIGSSVKNISLKYLSRIDEIQQSLANPKKRNIGDIYSGNAKITSASQLQPGNIIEIKLNGGVVRAEVK
ncbi:MAG: exodeoxyribonuclease VII large subunit, partial [Bacteroidales bacterium]|nr:exodeoxyribonuclease VII large subunit [Bacteroidales bacterium]